jgi:DNA-directed RNA polymerase specialized sigma24 family protein
LAAAENREAWALRVAFNLSANRWRRLALERKHRWTEAPVGPDAVEILALRDAIDELPPRQRAAVICHLLGLDVRATALALDCAEGTVKSLTSHGLTGHGLAGHLRWSRFVQRSGRSASPVLPLAKPARTLPYRIL